MFEDFVVPVSRIVGAPQLTRLLAEVPLHLVEDFLRSSNLRNLSELPDPLGSEPKADVFREHLVARPADDLRAIEYQAIRVERLSGQRAASLHLRLAEGKQFGCLDDLSEQPGALSRAVWSYSRLHALFVATERAMQVRSFRDHQRIFQAYELQAPHDLELDEFDESTFADEIASSLSLQYGCRSDAVELPERDGSPRQIMIAISAAGARESQKTFEPDRSVGVLQYRPVSELILVYMPSVGRIELCGRQWSDRKIVADVFARDVLGENLSKRPLTQRNYDLSKFKGNLDLDVPELMEDQIRSVDVTELRIALGSYDRKVTLTVVPGEDIDSLRRDVFGALRSRHARGFVCDVELFLRVVLPERGEKSLRFRLTNHNTSTLQSETDPELRAVGFALLEAWGVVQTARNMDDEEREDLLPILLELFDHPSDEISGPELKQVTTDIERLTATSFLRRRQIVETIVIDDEDLGEIRASVAPDLKRGTADVSLDDTSVDRRVGINEVSRWIVNREYILETIRESLSGLPLSGKARPVSENVHFLGALDTDKGPLSVFLASRLHEDREFARADRDIRAESEERGGVVFTPTHTPTDYLGSHTMLDLRELLPAEELTVRDITDAVRSRGSRAEMGDGVYFKKYSASRAELQIPGPPVWTIVGEKQVLIVERLYQAHAGGEKMVRSQELLDYARASQLGSTFGKEWKDRIRDVYIHSPSSPFWALKVGPS